MASMTTEQSLDASLWRSVREGDARAFQRVVERHQAVVCGVAYNACGNLALSEDVAQETFWAAWRQRDSLVDPGRLKAWLCGIARNLAANAKRRSSVGKPSVQAGKIDDLIADEPDPADVAIGREEEALLWGLLEKIPPTYREPLILFYREDQSVAEVAACLDLSEDAVKQRLSRGRAMLRDRIADQVEAGLRRSRPGRSFTTGVMAGLSLSAAGAKSAVAAGTSLSTGAAAKAAFASGMTGGLLGSLTGIAGGWLGAWIPAQLAPTVRERDLYIRVGRRMILASFVLLGVILILIKMLGGTPSYLIGWGATLVLFQAYVFVEAVGLSRAVQPVRQTSPPGSDVNETALRRGAASLSARYRGRVYRSPIRLLGLPLLDIQVADPRFTAEPAKACAPRIARGWIAIGDEARGILLGFGSRACGLVALGGVAIGLVSLGGVAIGLVAVGGLGLGALALGGLAIGGIAFGGGAIGWQACGGLAVAWDLAIGGGAVAWNTAAGGSAVAHGVVVRDPAAIQQTVARAFEWMLTHAGWVRPGTIGVVVIVQALATLILYRRNRHSDNLPTALLLPALLLADPGCSSAEGPTRVHRFQLDNGLKAVARPIEGATQTALVVLYDIGGDHDPEGRSGLAHMVEHVYATAAAGGTPARSAADFLHRYPAGCNAQTGDRYTAVATVFPPEQLDAELREAAARMADLTIIAADLDRERPRIVGELANMFEGVPSLAAMNQAREILRPTPRGGRRGGLPRVIESLTLEDVQNRWKRYYKPRNAVLIAAGAIHLETLHALVPKYFGPLAGGRTGAECGRTRSSRAGRGSTDRRRYGSARGDGDHLSRDHASRARE